MATYIPIDSTTRNRDVSGEKSKAKPSRRSEHEEQNYRYSLPSENQPAKATEKETLQYRTFSAPLKAGKKEDYLQGSRTQQAVAAELALWKKKEKAKEEKPSTPACRKAREKRPASYDRTEPTDDDVVRHIIRLREKLGWQTLPYRNLEYRSFKTTAQKIILKEPLKDDGEFVYCLPRENPEVFYNQYDLQVTKSSDGEQVELIPALEWLLERRCYCLLRQFKIFSNFRINKAFVTWKLNVKRIKMERSRSSLLCHLFWADELFQGCLLYIKGLCEDAVNPKSDDDAEASPAAICLVKLDRSQTYSLDEFCEEQLQQANHALKQLEDIRGKAISEVKSTLLKVAEKKEIREYFESNLPEDDRAHFKLPKYRRLLKTVSRFLLLVDCIFQELIRQLMNTAVMLLLELFNSSARVPFSVAKRNENLIK
uniref:Dynein axonemal heavy chain 14 n=1 Tax=Molossus molossus TaxID=27622 RepID=A0A7J8BLV1_MOLMO|nr:dynein axonemal heavy chain 14 [Molossus molossus]